MNNALNSRRAIFKQYITPNLDYVHKICLLRTRAPDNIEDLYHEILARLLQNIIFYDDEVSIKSWIMKIAMNHITAKYSKKLVMTEYGVIDDMPSDLFYCDWEYEPMISAGMTEAIKTLKPISQTAVTLMFQGYSVNDIAIKLHDSGLTATINKKATRKMLYDAQKRLSDILDRKGNLLTPLSCKVKPHKQNKSYRQSNVEVNPVKDDNMAKLKSEMDKYVSLTEKEYFELIEDQLLVKALKTAGLEELPIYKAAKTILTDARIEIHLKPIKKNYR